MANIGAKFGGSAPRANNRLDLNKRTGDLINTWLKWTSSQRYGGRKIEGNLDNFDEFLKSTYGDEIATKVLDNASPGSNPASSAAAAPAPGSAASNPPGSAPASANASPNAAAAGINRSLGKAAPGSAASTPAPQTQADFWKHYPNASAPTQQPTNQPKAGLPEVPAYLQNQRNASGEYHDDGMTIPSPPQSKQRPNVPPTTSRSTSGPQPAPIPTPTPVAATQPQQPTPADPAPVASGFGQPNTGPTKPFGSYTGPAKPNLPPPPSAEPAPVASGFGQPNTGPTKPFGSYTGPAKPITPPRDQNQATNYVSDLLNNKDDQPAADAPQPTQSDPAPQPTSTQSDTQSDSKAARIQNLLANKGYNKSKTDQVQNLLSKKQESSVVQGRRLVETPLSRSEIEKYMRKLAVIQQTQQQQQGGYQQQGNQQQQQGGYQQQGNQQQGNQQQGQGQQGNQQQGNQQRSNNPRIDIRSLMNATITSQGLQKAIASRQATMTPRDQKAIVNALQRGPTTINALFQKLSNVDPKSFAAILFAMQNS